MGWTVLWPSQGLVANGAAGAAPAVARGRRAGRQRLVYYSFPCIGPTFGGGGGLYCTQCGQLRTETASYCAGCGLGFGPPAPSPVQPRVSIARSRGAVSWGSGEVALGVLALALGAVLVAAVAVWLAARGGEIRPALAAWITSSLLGAVILPVVWVFGPRRWKGLLPALGLKAPRQRWPLAAAMTVGVLGASLAATALYSQVLEWRGWSSFTPPDIPREIVFPGVAAVLSFQALAGWTPFTEELFFRGFVFGGLVARWGAVASCVASALVFSAFHLSPGLLAPVFVTGLLLAWLYHRTGSLWPCVAAHAGQNAIALIATIYGV